MNRRRIVRMVLVLASSLGALLSVFPAFATPLNTNLIVNPDAESPLATGWTVGGGLEIVAYGTGGGFPDLSVSSAIGGGTGFFSGGPDNDNSTASQTISLADLATAIDAGNLAANLSGYLGGYSGQNDHAVLTAFFQAADDSTLGQVAIGPVTAADRSNLTTLLYRANSGAIPPGTRTVRILLEMTRTEGSYNDGYADNLALSVHDSRFSLTVNISGKGTVNNIAAPPAFTSSPPGTTDYFAPGTDFVLMATPDYLYDFTGWSGGGCNGTGSCLITLNGDTIVTATFTPQPLVRIDGSTVPYLLLSDAFAAAGNGSVLRARNVTFQEEVILDNPAAFSLTGGYESDFTTINGTTVLNGRLTVKSGRMSVANLVIH